GATIASAGYGSPWTDRLPRLEAGMRGRHLCFMLLLLPPAMVAAVPLSDPSTAHLPASSPSPTTHTLLPPVLRPPSPTDASPTLTPAPLPTSLPTATYTATASATSTPYPTWTATATATPAATVTPTASPTATAVPTATATPIP